MSRRGVDVDDDVSSAQRSGDAGFHTIAPRISVLDTLAKQSSLRRSAPPIVRIVLHLIRIVIIIIGVVVIITCVANSCVARF
jgi:hypothetical protein